MFLGIFSSIIPYLIAAGFYLAWVLFSFVQPLLSNKKTPDLQNEAKEVLSLDVNNKQEIQNDAYQFEDHEQDFNAPATDYCVLQAKPENSSINLSVLHPPDQDQAILNPFILSGIFSRPPPSC